MKWFGYFLLFFVTGRERFFLTQSSMVFISIVIYDKIVIVDKLVIVDKIWHNLEWFHIYCYCWHINNNDVIEGFGQNMSPCHFHLKLIFCNKKTSLTTGMTRVDYFSGTFSQTNSGDRFNRYQISCDIKIWGKFSGEHCLKGRKGEILRVKKNILHK